MMPPRSNDGRTEGERLRDGAMARAGHRHAGDIWGAQARMLAAGLGRDGLTFTSDDATPEGERYAGNTGWLGAAVRQLALRPWIESAGHVRSAWPTRKANFVRRWLIVDRGAAEAALSQLRRLVDAIADAPTPEADTERTLFDDRKMPEAATLVVLHIFWADTCG